MTQFTEPDMVPLRVNRLASIAEIAAIFGMVALGILVIYFGFLAVTGNPKIDAILREELLAEGATATFTPLIRISAYALAMVPMLVMVFALDRTRRLFQGYRRGGVFTTSAANRLRVVGWAVFALAPVSVLAQAGCTMLLTVLNAPGERQLDIRIDDGDILAIVFGLLLILLARILHEAARISDENKSFV